MKIKGFDKNLCCRGMQFEIGKTYETGAKDNEISLCSDTVFHYCDSIQKVHDYYSCAPDSQNRFCEIEVLGAEVSDEEKCGSNKIRIVREIVGDELNTLLGLINGNIGLFNTGNRNSGNRNSGDRNSGDWNSCNDSNGIFCNESDRNIRIFNRPSGMSLWDFRRSRYYNALVSVPLELTRWDEESKTLKERSYKEACAIWWNALTEENKEIIQQIPNFDPEIFFDITGIDLRGER